MGEEVFVSVLLGGDVLIAWVDLDINFVGGVPSCGGGDVYFLND